MPVRLVDGSWNIVEWMNTKEELLRKIGQIERFYFSKGINLENLDGEQNPEDYDEKYYARYGTYEWTQWHDDHAKALIGRTGCESMIDIGCGIGNIVLGFIHKGVDAWGLEYSKYAVEKANMNSALEGRVFWGDIKDCSTLPNRGYDLSVGYDLFEHVPNPESVVRNFCGLSNRWLHVKVPDIRGLNPEESKKFDPSHVSGRSLSWWIERFEECGFTLVLDQDWTLIKFDPEYALRPVGAPDLHALFKRKLGYR